MHEDVDLTKYALIAEDPIVAHRIVTAKQRERRQQRFTMVPEAWKVRLRGARHIASYRVALCVLHLHWKHKGGTFTLANGVLAEERVDRKRKWEALDELERLGMISIDRRQRKSPVVTVHLDPLPTGGAPEAF